MRWTVLVGVLLLAPVACGPAESEDAPAQLANSPAPTVVATIEVAHMHALGVGTDGIWTANYEDGSVSLVDPARNEVIETVQVDKELASGPTELHPDADGVWLVAGDTAKLGYLDRDSMAIDEVVHVGPAGVIGSAATQEGLWVAQYSGSRLLEPTPTRHGQIHSANAEVPLPGKYNIYSDIASGDVGVWAVGEGRGTLAAIAPSEGAPEVALTGSAFQGAQAEIEVGLGYVWVEASDGATSRVSRYDPETSQVETIEIDGQQGIMAVSDDALWVLTHEDERASLWRVDPNSMQVSGSPLTLDGEFQLSDMEYGFGSLWISHNTNLLTRIDVTGQAPEGGVAPSPEPRGDAEVCDQRGPWAWCPEADWLRHVIAEAGFRVTGDTGSSLEAAVEELRLHAWNTDAIRPLEEIAAEEGYAPHGDGEVYSDGSRLVWEAQGLHIYLSSADQRSVEEISDGALDALVYASREVPREADLSEAKPQPTPTTGHRSEETDDGRFRVWPRTEDVPNEGKYLYTAEHCGLDWMIDFDGSFWEPEKPDDYGDGAAYSFFYNSDEGAITFTGDDTAIYQASTGEKIDLKRLPGPTIVEGCE